jgi:hypothetical protein
MNADADRIYKWRPYLAWRCHLRWALKEEKELFT